MARERKFAGLALDGVSAAGAFGGYASLFGATDLAGDVVERGAFEKSLAARGASGVRMLFQHDPALVIGRWTEIVEDGRGLRVAGRLNLDVARAREVHALMKTGALDDGLSIGFRTVRARRVRGEAKRRILEADLWEISVVTFPMLPGARVAQIKALPAGRDDAGAVLKRLAGTIRQAVRTSNRSNRDWMR
ncbi:MAG: HK97 family phage prohead protease [Rhizobiaceae bacterium]|nr:HK97 family phage prohead protease [Rhizobiaceae bacterium]MCV0405486.1 HK97 family phage prohead protease [Rhizobiaceae bacterium]